MLQYVQHKEPSNTISETSVLDHNHYDFTTLAKPGKCGLKIAMVNFHFKPRLTLPKRPKERDTSNQILQNRVWQAGVTENSTGIGVERIGIEEMI